MIIKWRAAVVWCSDVKWRSIQQRWRYRRNTEGSNRLVIMIQRQLRALNMIYYNKALVVEVNDGKIGQILLVLWKLMVFRRAVMGTHRYCYKGQVCGRLWIKCKSLLLINRMISYTRIYDCTQLDTTVDNQWVPTINAIQCVHKIQQQ